VWDVTELHSQAAGPSVNAKLKGAGPRQLGCRITYGGFRWQRLERVNEKK
jgi:hypothetical protein